jgi:circadian clock protein KaiC
MAGAARIRKTAERALPKALTGIQGLDEITAGGLPRGRPTLICGSAGCGKTLLAMEFLLHGALEHNEPGVFMAFEETAEELAQNMRPLGFDLDDLVHKQMLAVDFVRVERGEIEEAGEFDLEGLFVRLGYAIDAIGAKRVVLDTIETLFSSLPNAAIIRAELRRLFRWLKDKGVTAIITGERGEGTLTRNGLEEYVSDCVILLDHRVTEQISTRRLRIVKYRGTSHGTNEYPFLIDEKGFSVLPITSMGLRHPVSQERISSGVPRLDTMLGGKGYYRGSSVLVSGTAGTGKSSLCAHFAAAACQRGESCLYLAFEESPEQIIRNMSSIGLDLGIWLKKGLLRFHAVRSTTHGLEVHLAMFHKMIQEFRPRVIVVDPISTLVQAGETRSASAMLTRLIDFIKGQQITALMTSLTESGAALEGTDVKISSLVDTWLLLRDLEASGERNRALYVLKSRGMAHSNQIREFVLTDRGIQLLDVYIGPEGVLTGSSRLAQEARENAGALARQQDLQARQRERQRKQEALEARIFALRKEFEAEDRETRQIAAEESGSEHVLAQDREAMAQRRQADSAPDPRDTRKAPARRRARSG